MMSERLRGSRGVALASSYRAFPSAERARSLASLAVSALVDEALLTPKPALVDRRGSGAHRDLDLHTLLCSARTLGPTFLRMAECASLSAPDQALREHLAKLGRAGELDMLVATGGSNAHRGAIWALGLLVASSAHLEADATPAEIAALAGRIAMLPDRYAPKHESHGSRVMCRYGVGGARGEAAAGFPQAIEVGLPTLWAARARRVGERHARLDALVGIMAGLDDTCLLHRGGWTALEAAQRGARAVLAAGGTSTEAGWHGLLSLDAELKALNASPGGCADMLAVSLFLDRACTRSTTLY